MKNERIRLKGLGIGQVKTELVEAYQQKFDDDKLTVIAKNIIEKNILGRSVLTTEDLVEANQLIRRMYYENIGEYIEEHMRNKLIRISGDENIKRIHLRSVTEDEDIASMCEYYGISKLSYLRGLAKGLTHEEAINQANSNIIKEFSFPFAERLQALRIKNGYSQVELAGTLLKNEQIDISEIYLSALETGRKTPDIDKLKAISDCFGVSCDYLIGISDDDFKVESNHIVASDVFSERLRNIRKSLGYTQEDVATRMRQYKYCEKMSSIKLSTYEKGRQKPNISRVIAMTKFYNTTLSYLLGQVEK